MPDAMAAWYRFLTPSRCIPETALDRYLYGIRVITMGILEEARLATSESACEL
jgi:hypothetical protein